MEARSGLESNLHNSIGLVTMITTVGVVMIFTKKMTIQPALLLAAPRPPRPLELPSTFPQARRLRFDGLHSIGHKWYATSLVGIGTENDENK